MDLELARAACEEARAEIQGRLREQALAQRALLEAQERELRLGKVLEEKQKLWLHAEQKVLQGQLGDLEAELLRQKKIVELAQDEAKRARMQLEGLDKELAAMKMLLQRSVSDKEKLEEQLKQQSHGHDMEVKVLLQKNEEMKSLLEDREQMRLDLQSTRSSLEALQLEKQRLRELVAEAQGEAERANRLRTEREAELTAQKLRADLLEARSKTMVESERLQLAKSPVKSAEPSGLQAMPVPQTTQGKRAQRAPKRSREEVEQLAHEMFSTPPSASKLRAAPLKLYPAHIDYVLSNWESYAGKGSVQTVAGPRCIVSRGLT